MNFLCLCVSYTTIIPLYAWLSFCVAPTFFHNTAHNKGSPNGFQKIVYWKNPTDRLTDGQIHISPYNAIT